MNKIYEKGVTRNQQASSHTLAILMSMLRVWLEYGWSMARVWLKYASPTTRFLRPFSSKRAELERRLVGHEITTHSWRDYGSLMTRLRLTISLLLMLTLGSGSVWGQTSDYSGTYYIRSESTNKNTNGDYYLCPTKNWYLYKATNSYEDDTDDNDDNGQPFLTTYQCKNGVYDASKAVWDVVKHPTETNCYYIIQRKTGRYMVSNGKIGSDANRMRVHLEAVADATALANLGNLALFEITSHGTHIDIVPHSTDGRNGDTYKYLVVNFKNFNELKGSAGKQGGPNGTYGTNTAGIIGLYDQEENHKWFLESAKCTTPVITFDNVTSKVTITAGDGETIYYTTDGNNPDAVLDKYNNEFELTEGVVIKAISKKDGLIDSEIATLTVEKLATPTISFNEETREVTITAVEGAVIYYTTDDTGPTTEETTAHAASPVVIAHALPSTKIHARAVKSGYINSDIVTKTDIPVKVLTNPTIILAEDDFVYDGSAKEPAITVKDGDVDVSADEYVVTYSSNTNAGTASVTVSDKADGDYEVNGSKNFTISPKSLGDGNTAAEGITVEMTEDGSLSAVKDGSTTLVENTDYTQEAEEDGSDKIITITGIGNYTGIVKGIYASPQFDDPDGDGGPGQAAAVYMAKRDLSCPSGINPYIIRKVNPSIGTAVITPLDYIPVDVPVLLLSDAEASGFVASPKDPSTPEVTAQTKNSNLLKVSAGGETVKAAQIYMFYKGEFVLTKAGTLGEGKFYLYNPNYANTSTNENSGSSNARGLLQFVIDDEEPTGITEFETSTTKKPDTDVWYTLDGRRLSVKPSKAGIYIHQGQKEYIKR